MKCSCMYVNAGNEHNHITTNPTILIKQLIKTCQNLAKKFVQAYKDV